MDAALHLAPAGSRVTLLHVTPAEVPDAARGAYAGLLGRGGHDPGVRLDQMAAASASELLEAAADRLGRDCERLEITGRPERAVVAASAQADLLVVARDGDRARPGPKSLGKATRFVVDHAACPVLLVWPGSAPDVGTIPPAATSPFPAGSVNPQIAANAIVHAGAGGRLILRRAASGLRCLVADTVAPTISHSALCCPTRHEPSPTGTTTMSHRGGQGHDAVTSSWLARGAGMASAAPGAS